MASALDRLLTQLNTSSTAASDKALGQVIQQLIQRLKDLEKFVAQQTSGGGGSVTNNTFITQQLINPLAYLADGGDTYYFPAGVTSTPTPASGDDYVVLSDGVTPIPSPVNDGAGNFIYVGYTP